jgi:hypothetical protein
MYHTLVTLKTSMVIKGVRIDGEQCMKPRRYVSVHCVRVRTVARRRAMDVSDGWHEGAVAVGGGTRHGASTVISAHNYDRQNDKDSGDVLIRRCKGGRVDQRSTGHKEARREKGSQVGLGEG